MYTQIMKEILLTIKFEQEHVKELIDYCGDIFDDNETELKKYTYECFPYPMLSRAVQMSDAGIIIRMGLFIGRQRVD
jgi:hypothetical protein